VEFPYPLLVCDIGGTNVRSAFLSERGASPHFLPPQLIASFPDFSSYADGILADIGERPRSIIACGAGTVMNRHLQLTNAAWTVNGPQIAYCFGLSQGLLLNDFEAQALSLPIHRPEWLRVIGPSLPTGSGPRLILGPGTGLGVAALISDGGRYLSLASEAGHAEFAPLYDAERAIWAKLDPMHGRITGETLISGPGLARLHQARAQAFGFEAHALDAPALIVAAKEDLSSQAAQTLRHFWRLVARLSGDLALVFLARGGVTLSGGVLPRITEFLDADVFRQNFEAKAPMEHLLRSVPTQLLEAENAVLIGMAAIAAYPQNYIIDYPTRAWR
jgi:glucokinase